MKLFPPDADRPLNNLNTTTSLHVDGVALDYAYSHGASSDVLVGAFCSILSKRSWLGWAATSLAVPADRIESTAREMGKALLANLNTEVLCTAAMEELQRHRIEASAKETACRKQAGRQAGADHYHGQLVGLAAVKPILEVVIDRLGVGLVEKANAPQAERNAAEPQLTHAEGVAALVGAISDGVGDRADIRVVVADKDGTSTLDLPARDSIATDRLLNDSTTREDLVRMLRAAQAERDRLVHETARLESDLNKYVARVQTLTEEGTGMAELARRGLMEDGIADPSSALLRARLAYDHMKAARDIAHSWSAELTFSSEGLAHLEQAEQVTTTAYRLVTDRETDDRLVHELTAHKVEQAKP